MKHFKNMGLEMYNCDKNHRTHKKLCQMLDEK